MLTPFLLLIGAAVLLRIPAMEASGRLRATPEAGLRLRGTRYAFDALSTLALLLALWRLPGLSGTEVTILRAVAATVVAFALIVDGVRLFRPAPPQEP